MSLFTKSSSLEGIVQLIVVFIMFLFVLALAYFAARLAGTFQGNVQSKSNIKIMETARLGNNKFVQIVKIGNRYFVLGNGKDSVTFLAELDESDLNIENLNNPNKGSFKDILSQFQQKKKDDKNDETNLQK